jgi:hypothetical protein
MSAAFTPEEDEQMAAAIDLFGRVGARSLEIGYLHDDVPAELADWYAHVQYAGTRIIEEGHPGPVQAAEALARRLLTGARCQHCGGLVSLTGEGAMFYAEAQMADGSTFTEEEARSRPQCHWERKGRKWVRGCEGRIPEGPNLFGPNRAQRRAAKKGRR